MKNVYSARDEVDAHLIQGLLAQHGIDAVVQTEGLSGILGTVQTSPEAAPSLWVKEEDEAAAIAALSDIKDGQTPVAEGVAWKCPNCGESIEPQFSECWNCGESRPATTDETSTEA